MPHEFIGRWRYTFLQADGAALNAVERGVINITALNNNGSGLAGHDTPSDGRLEGDVTGSASAAGATSGTFIRIDKTTNTGAHEFFDGAVLFTLPGRIIIAGTHKRPVVALDSSPADSKSKRPFDGQAQDIWVATKP